MFDLENKLTKFTQYLKKIKKYDEKIIINLMPPLWIGYIGIQLLRPTYYYGVLDTTKEAYILLEMPIYYYNVLCTTTCKIESLILLIESYIPLLFLSGPDAPTSCFRSNYWN